MTTQELGREITKAPLRIAILGSRGIPAHYGGFETFAEMLSCRLAARGHQVTVYAEAGSAGVPDSYYQKVRVKSVHRPSWGAASVIAYDIACLWDARRQYDLVYMLGYGAAWACGLPRLFGTPVWINIDGLEWTRSKWNTLARLYLRVMEWVSSWMATRVIADAQAIATRYRRCYPFGAPCDFIAYGAESVAPSGLDTEQLAKHGLSPGTYALIVARPEPENHILEMVEGFVESASPWTLVVVGDVHGGTVYQQKLLSYAGERVRFLGGVYNSLELQTLRLGAACYLHGHSVGGTNPSLLEALACGNLVIAHDNPYNQEVAGNIAWYFSSSEDVTQILALVSEQTTAERDQRQRQARSIIEERYTWDAITDAYETLMQQECNRGRTAG